MNARESSFDESIEGFNVSEVKIFGGASSVGLHRNIGLKRERDPTMVGEAGKDSDVRSADGHIDSDEFINIGPINRVVACRSRRIENGEIECITAPC